MHVISNRLASGLALGSSCVLGVVLPIMMTPASKSSPLFLVIATALAVTSVVIAGRLQELMDQARLMAQSPVIPWAATLALVMFASIAMAHDPLASLSQFTQFALPLLSGLLLALAFPLIADRDRALWWTLAAAIAALIIVVDIKTGLGFRRVTGGRTTDYAYNRTIVTLMVLLWPLLALIVERRRWPLLLVLLPLAAAAWIGESATAVLALAIGVAVFPLAWLAPRLTRFIGLAGILLMLIITPVIGSLARLALGERIHKTFEGAHSSERMDIWVSFEAALHKTWFLGNGFGSSQNLFAAAVARGIDADKAKGLMDSHPHNAFLQLWVELGLVGACLAAVLFWHLFKAVDRAQPRLQPYILTWIAVICGIALVSHGAWQAWWIAAIAASAVGFITLQREIDRASANSPRS